ncbi:MAG: Gfo/Idh/MocA family oxidoreductase [Clostridiaceae bacterium]|nr:Gfo/Idh/MocA family oxidoreductase [Clostridiaceae bacterium]
MKKTIKWGIIGTGAIAHTFAESLGTIKDAELVAVGASSKEKAEAFGKEFNIPSTYGNYSDLVNDVDVEIIYVATIHPLHKECVLLALKAGKAVICEKPLTVNAKETEEIIKCARDSKVFFMEAMWTRYLPAIVKVRQWLKAGLIGNVKMLKAEFGFCCDGNAEGRLFNANLGGGALLDAGIYPISFASMVFGSEPKTIRSMAHIGETKVDEYFSCILGYEEDKMAILSGAIQLYSQNDAWIIGTEGKIFIPNFLRAESATLFMKDEIEEKFEMKYSDIGYSYEAKEAMNCIRENKLESEIMPMDESLAIMKIMDELRKQWGLKYPFEV